MALGRPGTVPHHIMGAGGVYIGENEYRDKIIELLAALNASVDCAIQAGKTGGALCDTVDAALIRAVEDLHSMKDEWVMRCGEPWAGYLRE